MKIVDYIKNHLTDSRKKKSDMVPFLSLLFSDIVMVGKNAKPPRETTDDEALRVIKKMGASIDETVKLTQGDAVDESKVPFNILQQRAYVAVLIDTFQPKQLSKDNIYTIISERVGQGDNLGMIMGYFKKNYPGQYDGKIVSEMAKKVV